GVVADLVPEVRAAALGEVLADRRTELVFGILDDELATRGLTVELPGDRGDLGSALARAHSEGEVDEALQVARELIHDRHDQLVGCRVYGYRCDVLVAVRHVGVERDALGNGDTDRGTRLDVLQVVAER